MPKTKQIENTAEKVVETSSIENKLDQVLVAIEKLTEAFVKPITSQAPPDEPRPSLERTLTNEQGKAPEVINTIPVPTEFRQQVDSVLNSMFGIEIEPTGDPLSMLFTVVVPEKYSRLTESQKDIGMRDVSPKVIDRAMGVNGVKEWCETVYRNFTPEVQAQIAAERK
jgi:hypothetical protein